MTEKQMQRLLDRKAELHKQKQVAALYVVKVEAELAFARAKEKLESLRLDNFKKHYLS